MGLRLDVIDYEAAARCVVVEDDAEVRIAPRATERFAWLGIPDRTPCVDAETPDEVALSRFFAELWVLGGLAENTVRAYAKDVVLWARFLREARGRSWVEADRSDLLAFHTLRRWTGVRTGAGVARTISGQSWDRAMCALSKLYEWAETHELVERPPFVAKGANSVAIEEHARWGRRGSRRFGREGAPASRHAMVVLDEDQYRLWRDVGVRGLGRDGAPVPGWRGRTSERNARFCDGLVTSGARVSEFAHLLVPELPDPNGAGGGRAALVELPFASAVVKGGVGRIVPVAATMVGRLWDYVRWDRARRVRAARSAGSYDALARNASALLCRKVTSRGCEMRTEAGGWERRLWADIGPVERRRLLEVDAAGEIVGPVMLWVAEGGLPADVKTWQTMFGRASERCRDHGIDLNVTPHVFVTRTRRGRCRR